MNVGLKRSLFKKHCFPRISLSWKLMRTVKKHPIKRKLICEKCNASFPNWWEIRDHWQTTAHKAPEQCYWCHKKTFTLQSHLCKQHWNVAAMCNYCGQLFMFKEDLETHLLHHDKTEYRCCQCGRRRKTEDLLKTHMYNHFIYEKYGCNVCEKRFKKKKNMENHLMMIHFICQYCGNQCDNKEEFLKHLKTHNDLQCVHCQKRFSQKNRLKYHYQLQHGHQDFYKCSLCFQRFVIKGRLLDHMKLKHSGNANFSCKICAAPFLYWQQYCNHFENKHAKPSRVDNLKCSFCDFSTNRKPKLQWHVEKTSGTGFFCKKCQIKLECKGVFDKHMQIHEGESVWTCDFCPRSYTSDDTLSHHISLVHKDEMMAQNPQGYPCLIEGCNKYYTLKNSLSRHMRKIHSGSPTSRISQTCSENAVCHSPLLREVTKKEQLSTLSPETRTPKKSKLNLKEKLYQKDSELSTDDVSRTKAHQDSLSDDMTITTEVNVYYCNSCSKFWFTGESQFNRHMRTHVKTIWEEECSSCNMSLESPEEAARHYVEHHFKVKFVC